jgi:glycosyltransferase involved in cell wall biosynthesis
MVRTFGTEFSSVPVRQIETRDINGYFRSAGAAVFVNHTFMDFKANPARVGIYSQMFPVQAVNARRHRRETAALAGYNLMLSNSSFTKTYTDGLWDFPHDRSRVLHPPIGSRHTERAGALLAGAIEKKRQFLNVGRFNPGTHNKNQKLVIEGFLEARRRFPELDAWSLVLIGNSNKDEDSQRYLAECKALAEGSGGHVTIRQDLSEDDLTAALDEAFGYVHGTGAFLAPGEAPFKCEHFGLSIVEAMAHACIPLVFGRGGIFDVLEPGRMGIPYMTREGLVEGFQEIAHAFGTAAGAEMQRANLRAAQGLGQRAFTAKLAALIAAEFAK